MLGHDAVMFDIETLDTERTAVVVSIGACRFNPIDKLDPAEDRMALLLDMDAQSAVGRTISIGTLSWWMLQTDEARRWNFSKHNRYDVDLALRAFSAFCRGADQFWCRGTNFDPILLEDLCRQFGAEVPWRFNQLRDVRTLDELDPGHLSYPDVVAHKPLDDCMAQIAQVQAVFDSPKHGIEKLGVDVFSGFSKGGLFREGTQPGD